VLLLIVGFGWWSTINGQYLNIIFAFLSLPLFQHTYLWRGYQLFVLYNLTEYRFNQETISDSKNDQSHKSNWFYNKRDSVSQERLTRTYFIANIPIMVACLVIAIMLYKNLGSFGFIPVAAITNIESIALAILTIILRKVQDAFYLKRELVANAIINAVQALLMLYFGMISKLPIDFAFIIIIAYAFRLPFITIIPLYISYVSEKNSGSDSGREESASAASTHAAPSQFKVSKQYNTLDAILEEPTLQAVFVTYLKKRFDIQYVLFIEQVKAFKLLDAQLLAGKAFLMYHKFIKPEALLDLAVPKEIRIPLQDLITNEEKLLDPDAVKPTFFDSVEQFVRERLETPVKNFRTTDEFANVIAKLHEETKLNMGLVNTGIV